MSRKARAQSSLALALVLPLVVLLWFAGRSAANAGEEKDKLSAKDTVLTDASAPKKAPASRTAVFPLPTDFQSKLIMASLDPRSLAAAGVAQQSVLSTLQAAADRMNAAPSALEISETSGAAARVAADALARKIQSGKASQEEIASYPAAKTAFESAVAARQSVLDGYFSDAIASLSVNQRVALANIRENKSWELPVEYLVVNRSEADWIALRDALANERIAVDLPETLSESAQALLTTVRADQTVAAARTNIQSALPAITSAWNTAAGN
jgi:hypothetical protein